MKTRNAVITIALAGIVGWNTAKCTYKPDEVEQLHYEYNDLYHQEMLVGQTKSISDYYIVKNSNGFSGANYSLTVKMNDNRYNVIRTDVSFVMEKLDNTYDNYGNFTQAEYIIPLIDVANYFDNTVVYSGRVFSADEINYLIEQLKNNEKEILENEYIKKRIKTP